MKYLLILSLLVSFGYASQSHSQETRVDTIYSDSPCNKDGSVKDEFSDASSGFAEYCLSLLNQNPLDVEIVTGGGDDLVYAVEDNGFILESTKNAIKKKRNNHRKEKINKAKQQKDKKRNKKKVSKSQR